MSELAFEVGTWFASDDPDEDCRATSGALHISAGGTVLTEVEDTLARSVRPFIHVPAVLVAEWLLLHWWRIRWEGRPAAPRRDWVLAHRLASIGGDHAWPLLELSSDGSFVHVTMAAENAPDVASIRYLRSVNAAVPAAAFESAVDRFIDVVAARLDVTRPGSRRLGELREELTEERTTPRLSRHCRWQARAGFHPGEAPDGWLERAAAMSERVGENAVDELLTVAGEGDGDLAPLESLVRAMERSATTVDLSWIPRSDTPSARREMPWQAGARLAQDLRRRERLGTGPISDVKLSELVSAPLPLPGTVVHAPLAGGVRDGATRGRTHIVVTSRRPETQRFYLARLIAAATVLPPSENLLPVSEADTALQKLERSFAQELLCPWAALDNFTDEHGVGEDAILDAAEHFRVSEWLVRSTLVNRGKVPRAYLPV
jgi:hypothetical protein